MVSLFANFIFGGRKIGGFTSAPASIHLDFIVQHITLREQFSLLKSTCVVLKLVKFKPFIISELSVACK